MTIHERITRIEAEIDHDDVSSLVHGTDRLRELLVSTPAEDAVPVLLSLCPLLHDLDSYAELASVAAQAAASSHAGTRERLFGEYWPSTRVLTSPATPRSRSICSFSRRSATTSPPNSLISAIGCGIRSSGAGTRALSSTPTFRGRRRASPPRVTRTAA